MKKRLLLSLVVLMGLTSAKATDRIASSDFGINRGETKTFGIKLFNEGTNYVGFQMDLTLPDGLTINKAGCSLSARITDENQELTIGKQSENTYRLTSTSFSLTPISGTGGDLVTVSVTASDTYQGGNATISNIRFATSNSELVTMDDVTLAVNYGIITFADEQVKALCVANWDTNGDGELDMSEAYDVTDLGDVFYGSDITSFNELQYFTGLTSIGNQAFNWSLLTSVIIPNSVTSIGQEAFSCCSNLISIVIPNSVTSIGEGVFYNCDGLASIMVDSENTVFDSRDNCNAIIEKTTSTLIQGCQNTVIPNSVLSIGYYAFAGCSGLTSITIPNSVTSVGVDAFADCSGLVSITIPNSVTTIGSDAFINCSSLAYIIVESGNTNYDSRNNCNAIIETSSNTLIVGSKNTIIPYGVTSIGGYAFVGCTGLTSITIPKSVTSIGAAAFFECLGLTSVTIPESVTSIGWNSFYGCFGLTSVVVNIGFPLAISETTFNTQNNATLYVPKNSKTAYAAADYWKDFKVIKEFPDPDVNQDGYVDVVDVVDIARFVVGMPSESFAEFLADLNNSGDVNVADAVILVNEIAGDLNWSRSLHAPAVSDGVLTLTRNADQSLSFSLEGNSAYTAFQFDLYLPEGTDVEKMMLNNLRQQKHQLLYNNLENGHYRVAALSFSNNVFAGNNGELINLAVSGIDGNEISIRDIHFFDVEGNDYKFADITVSETTGIEKLIPVLSKGEEDIYDLQGRKMKVGSLTRGLYIVGGKKIVVK